MAAKIEALNKLGCDTVAALERFAGDETLYLNCVEIALTDEEFSMLGEAIANRDATAAAAEARGVTGMLDNLGLSPLHDGIVKITNLLKNADGEFPAEISDCYNSLCTKKGELCKELGISEQA